MSDKKVANPREVYQDISRDTPTGIDPELEFLRTFFEYDKVKKALVWKVPQLRIPRVKIGDVLHGTIMTKQSGAKYEITSIIGRPIFFHHLVWAIAYGAWPDGEMDHIDRNSLNNSLENLRLVSASDNCHNSIRVKGKYPQGVHRHKDYFRSRLTVNGKTVHERHYRTLSDAIKGYLQAKRKYCPEVPEQWYDAYYELWGDMIDPMRVSLP